MKKMRLKFRLSCLLFLIVLQSAAAPGDTTWVQAQNDVQLDWYNDFDEAVTFPDGSVTYSKIIMVFTLGKYQCPAGTQYCGDWDYTIQNYLMTPTDTFELSRLITPYANASYPRTPWNWKQRYYFDVTDFYPYLKNNATIRLSYHNYSGGFTGNIRFAFIEGTPPRTVTGITRLWEGAFNYGEASSIDTKITPVTVTAPAGTVSAEMKFTVTGHGADNNGCSEFCNRYYQVKQNGITLQQVNIWKSDCGWNNLYPQSGTWVYNRANWCPGELVPPASYKFSNISPATTYIADVDFQPYNKQGTGSPVYIVSGYMVHYGPFAYTVDASVEDIISPSDFEGHFRSNPMFGSPVVRIRNTGSSVINTVSFQYGVTGQTAQNHTATGLSLEPMAETLITLPELAALTTLTPGSENEFRVEILQVNGSTDGSSINNVMKSKFISAPVWPAQFTMIMKSNNYGTETKWRIESLDGTIIAQRNPTTGQATFNDVVNIPSNGAYRLVVTDAGCDGLYWWANASATGTGWIYTRDMQGALIPYTNGLPAYPSGLSQDFGCGFVQYFRVNSLIPSSTPDIEKSYDVMVNPNPFKDQLVFTITVARAQKTQLRLYDARGALVMQKDVRVNHGINHIVAEGLGSLSAGVYVAEVSGGGISFRKQVIKQ